MLLGFPTLFGFASACVRATFPQTNKAMPKAIMVLNAGMANLNIISIFFSFRDLENKRYSTHGNTNNNYCTFSSLCHVILVIFYGFLCFILQKEVAINDDYAYYHRFRESIFDIPSFPC